MKKILSIVVVAVLALGLGLGEAEAARFGGGKSFGMKRQAVTPRPAPGQQQAAPNSTSTPNAAPAPKRNWTGPLAGLAAGIGLAALFSHLGMGEGLANAMMIGLLIVAAVLVFRLLLRRNAPPLATQSASPLQYAATQPTQNSGAFSPQSAAPGDQQATTVPADFDSEGFLRIAKLNFVRMQAANDAKNLADMREFVSPEVFAEVKLQMDERGNAVQQTDIVTLDARMLEVVSEANQHIASVHFSGMIRETADTAAVPFDEIWHLGKPRDGSSGWVVCGIQQL